MIVRNFLIIVLLCYKVIYISSNNVFTPRLEYINYLSTISGSYSINYNGATTTKVFTELMQSDDSPLPKWVQFDPASGVFEVNPPKGFKGKLDVKVVARDDEGREVTAMFQLFVSDPSTAPVDGRPQGRNSFSEQLRFVSKRSAYLVKVAEAGPHKQPAHESRNVKARMG